MTNKEKRKGKPRRRLYLGLAIILLLVISGFFIAPYAEDRLVAWLEDDPFTPMCDAGHLELAFVRDNGISVVQGDGSNPQGVPESSMALDLEWSPTGEHLAFTVAFDHFDRLYIWDGEVSASPSESNPGISTSWSWSNDEQKIVYNDWSSNDPWVPDEGISYLWIADVSNFQNAFILAEGQNLSLPQWSPTNYDLLYWENGEWILAKLENDTYTYHVIHKDIEYAQKTAWSPDGHYIAYFEQSGLYLVDVKTLKSQFIPADAIFFWWSPDGQQIASTSGSEIIIWDIETGSEIWGFTGAMQDWSEQGIIYSSTSTFAPTHYYIELYTANVDTQTTVSFTESINYPGVFARWSPDNGKILYTFDNQNYYLTLPEADSNGDNSFHIATDYINFNQAWTPDNRYLTYQAENHWFYLLDLESYKSCRVVEGDGNFFTRYDWRIIPEEQK